MEVMYSCRCCLRGAPDMDLTTPYTHLGKTEIYSDMLKDCFNLYITVSSDGSRGICSACVGRLRDASDFKLQVQRSQAELQRMQGVTVVKDEILTVKIEMAENDGLDSETLHESLVKSEPVDGDALCNEDDISSGSVPLDGTGTEPASPASRNETPSPSGHIKDTPEDFTDEEYSSDTPEEQKTHGKQRYPCDLCDKDFVNKSALKRHHRVIHAEKQYSCEECDKRFTRKEQLDNHKRTHTGEKTFECDQCNKKFSQKRGLSVHKLNHAGDKPYECKRCNKIFPREWHLLKHEKALCKEGFICHVCNKKFAKRMVLIRHINIHSGVKPYVCEQCDKRFSRKEDLSLHKRVHSGKMHSCDQCDKAFLSNKSLLRHKVIHTGQKYECTVCNKQFIHSDTLKTHQRRVHTGEIFPKKLRYSCQECSKQFVSKSDLDRHARIHTGERPFECDICHKKYSQKSHLVTHTKTCHKPKASHSIK